jgi:hypothetical protein
MRRNICAMLEKVVFFFNIYKQPCYFYYTKKWIHKEKFIDIFAHGINNKQFY